MVRYNFGCGTNKIKDYINVDSNPDVSPDLVMDLKVVPYPIENESVDEVVMYHTIEHIEAVHHLKIFDEIHRIMKMDGKLILSFPEFKKCAMNYIENHQGKKEFWAATIFGRQSRPWDYHLALMDTADLTEKLEIAGFDNLEFYPESAHEPFNTICVATRTHRQMMYEDVLRDEIFGSPVELGINVGDAAPQMGDKFG